MHQQTRITIKGLKVAQFASEETLCFQAQVLFDGKLVGVAENDGHGGCTFVRASSARADLAGAEAFAKSLPPAKVEAGELGKHEAFEIPATLDGIIDELAYAEDTHKRLLKSMRRALKTKVLLAENGKIWVYKVAYTPEVGAKILAKRPGGAILNTMPEAAAILVYGACT